MAAGAIQRGGSWGKRPPALQSGIGPVLGFEMSRTTLILLLLVLLLVVGLFLLSNIDTEVEPTLIEQDVTNEALAK
jgi:hypothetical protein